MSAEVVVALSWHEGLRALRGMYDIGKSEDFCRRDARELRIMANGIDALLDEAEWQRRLRAHNDDGQ